MRLTDEEQLEVVERLIEQERELGGTYTTISALRAIAKDIRARLPDGAGRALEALQRAIDVCVATKTSLGYDSGQIQRVGEELIGRWPVVKLALERKAHEHVREGN